MAIANDLCREDRVTRVINGEVVSDSDSNTETFSNDHKLMVQKKRLAIKRRAKRLKQRAIAEARFLCRRTSPRTSKIVKECPRIGEVIEEFVKEHNVGADAWRRTGVLTFDGNVHLKCKVTYEKIRKHLETACVQTIFLLWYCSGIVHTTKSSQKVC